MNEAIPNSSQDSGGALRFKLPPIVIAQKLGNALSQGRRTARKYTKE